MTVFSTSTSPVFIPVTPWIEAADAQYARIAWEIAALNGNLEVTPAWQVADSEDSPGASNALDNSQTGIDVYYPNGWKTLITDGTAPTESNMLVRFGWICTLSSGSDLATAAVAGVVEYQGR